MTRSIKSHIRDALTSLLSPQFIRHHAAALGAVKRRRKVDVVALVCTLVLAFARGRKRSLASLRRAYAAATGTTLAPSAFYDRFTPSLAMLMQKLSERALAQLARGTKRGRAFGVFTKLLIADGSLVRLPDALERHYPSVWTNHTRASAKLHVINEWHDAHARPRADRTGLGAWLDPDEGRGVLHRLALRLRFGLLPRQALSPNRRARRALPLSCEEGCQLPYRRRRRRALGGVEP